MKSHFHIKSKFIFNFDETMIIFLKERRKQVCKANGTVCPKKIKKISQHLTLLLTISAEGKSFLPLLILPNKYIPPLADSVRDSFLISSQEFGWMNQEILNTFVKSVFVEEIDKMRGEGEKDEYVLLIVDGHSSRDGLNIMKLFHDHRIVVGWIPPHSSHITQPLDKKCNLVFKEYLSDHFQMKDGENLEDQRNRLLQVVDKALSVALAKANILDGWFGTI